jgi:hypothetical protein
MSALRVVSYLNQFFGHIGGEDKAGVGPQVFPSRPSPRRRLGRAAQRPDAQILERRPGLGVAVGVPGHALLRGAPHPASGGVTTSMNPFSSGR